MATVRANGTELYFEARGSGPTVLLIIGATGDAGHFEAHQVPSGWTGVHGPGGQGKRLAGGGGGV
jgi:hypothetical protein